MSTYRKRPVEVEARLVEPPYKAVAEWCGGFLVKESTGNKIAYIGVKTLEGVMRANFGDWIIKGVKGEFYPCKPDIFAATYEEVAP